MKPATLAAVLPRECYVVIAYCDEHGGHADVYLSLAGARAAIAAARRDWIEEEDADPDTFDFDTEDEIAWGERMIRLDIGTDGLPVPAPIYP